MRGARVWQYRFGYCIASHCRLVLSIMLYCCFNPTLDSLLTRYYLTYTRLIQTHRQQGFLIKDQLGLTRCSKLDKGSSRCRTF